MFFFLILVQAALTQDLDSVKLQVEDLQREKVPVDSLSRSISSPRGKVHLKLSFAFLLGNTCLGAWKASRRIKKTEK